MNIFYYTITGNGKLNYRIVANFKKIVSSLSFLSCEIFKFSLSDNFQIPFVLATFDQFFVDVLMSRCWVERAENISETKKG